MSVNIIIGQHFYSQFRHLDRDIQDQLLQKNSPLFIQFFYGCYLGMPSSSEQIVFLSNTSAFDDSQNSNFSKSTFLLINSIDFHLFNSMTKLFKPDSDVNFYNHLIGNLKRLQLSDSESTANLEETIAVLAYIILFNFQCVTSSSTNAEPVKSIRLNKKLLFENFINKDRVIIICSKFDCSKPVF